MTEAADGDSRNPAPSTTDSLREYGRGFAGGRLFSLPLLYTKNMEERCRGSD